MAKINYIYCDSCVFVAYFNAEPTRVNIIEQLFERVVQDKYTKLITSTLTIAEVSYTNREREQKRLKPDFETILDTFWANEDLLELADMHEIVAKNARKLLRYSASMGYGLKPPDAIHLATAQIIKVDEFFTYDDLGRYASKVGFNILEPYVTQPRLPGIDE